VIAYRASRESDALPSGLICPPIAERLGLPVEDYLDGMSVLWLATQSQASLRLIHVSVKRERIT
jgi:hypothetical protein